MLRRLLGRVAGFSLPFLLTTVTSLISNPIVIVLVGPTSWAGLAVVQSVAALATVVVGFGWAVSGPTMVAAADAVARPTLFRDSLAARCALFVVAFPLAALVAALIAPGLQPIDAVVALAAYLLPALGANWYFVGEARPRRLLVFDTMPRVLGIVTGLPLLAVTRDLTIYVSVMAAWAVLGVIATSVRVLRRATFQHALSPLRAFGRMREQIAGVLTSASSTIYANSPLIAASALITGSIEEFTLAFRLYLIALSLLSPITQVMQGWIPSTAGEVRHRVSVAARAAVVIAVIGGVLFALLAPWAGELLSVGRIDLGFDLSVPLGIAMAAGFTSQVLGLACLFALGRARVVAISTVVGSLGGIVALVLLGALWQIPGLAWSLAVAEWAVALIQVVALVRLLRRDDPPDARTQPLIDPELIA